MSTATTLLNVNGLRCSSNQLAEKTYFHDNQSLEWCNISLQEYYMDWSVVSKGHWRKTDESIEMCHSDGSLGIIFSKYEFTFCGCDSVGDLGGRRRQRKGRLKSRSVQFEQSFWNTSHIQKYKVNASRNCWELWPQDTYEIKVSYWMQGHGIKYCFGRFKWWYKN